MAPIALPRPGAVCTLTTAGRPVIWAKPSAIPTGIISCRPRKYRKSSGKSCNRVNSEEPGFPNQVVRPWERNSSIVASRTVVGPRPEERPFVWSVTSCSPFRFEQLAAVDDQDRQRHLPQQVAQHAGCDVG